jgi:toxin FitB
MLLDSNIIIYSSIPEYSHLRKFLMENENNLVVSEISKLEVLGYNKLSNSERIAFEFFFQNISLISVDSLIIEKAIELRQHKRMSLGDSIIAATALIHNHKLLTNNEFDFQHISDIQLIPMKSV